MRNSVSIWRNPTTIASLDRVFDDLFERTLSDPLKSWSGSKNSQQWFNPACDIEESEDHYLVCLELPGIKKEDVKVEVHNQQLTVSGHRKKERNAEGKFSTRVQEREYGEFRRVFTLPNQVNVEKIEATFQDGELLLSLPKVEAAKPRQIQIVGSEAA
jgi:HSP20 family protein